MDVDEFYLFLNAIESYKIAQNCTGLVSALRISRESLSPNQPLMPLQPVTTRCLDASGASYCRAEHVTYVTTASDKTN